MPRYTAEERLVLDLVAMFVRTEYDFKEAAKSLSVAFKRTECAIMKQLEIRKGWFWARKR